MLIDHNVYYLYSAPYVNESGVVCTNDAATIEAPREGEYYLHMNARLGIIKRPHTLQQNQHSGRITMRVWSIWYLNHSHIHAHSAPCWQCIPSFFASAQKDYFLGRALNATHIAYKPPRTQLTQYTNAAVRVTPNASINLWSIGCDAWWLWYSF